MSCNTQNYQIAAGMKYKMQQWTAPHQNTEAADCNTSRVGRRKKKKAGLMSVKTRIFGRGQCQVDGTSGEMTVWLRSSATASPLFRPNWITSASTDPQPPSATPPAQHPPHHPVRPPSNWPSALTVKTWLLRPVLAHSWGQTNKHLSNHQRFVARRHCLLHCCWISPSRCVFTAAVDTQASPILLVCQR